MRPPGADCMTGRTPWRTRSAPAGTAGGFPGGFRRHASRASWSHDLGDAIVFDAWDERWERDDAGGLVRYPLRTLDAGYSLEDAQENPRPGHTRWQRHVDLVLAGLRRPRAILPVAGARSKQGKANARGWRPIVVEGEVQVDRRGQAWLVAREVTRLPEAGSSAPA